MAAKARLEGELSWTDSAFVRGIASATKRVTGFAKSTDSAMGGVSNRIAGIGAALATYISARSFLDGIKGAYDFGGSLVDMQQKTRLSIESLISLNQAFKDNGVDADMLGVSMKAMAQFMGEVDAKSKKSRVALSQLSLTAKDLDRLSPDELFNKFGVALEGIIDPLQRSRVAADIFGKSSQAMLQVFGDKAFGKTPDFLRRQAEVLNQSAAIFDEISDKLNRSGSVLRGFWIGVGDAIATRLNTTLDKFEAIDWVGKGKAFGDEIAKAYDDVVAIGKEMENYADKMHFGDFALMLERMGSKVGFARESDIKRVMPHGMSKIIKKGIQSGESPSETISKINKSGEKLSGAIDSASSAVAKAAKSASQKLDDQNTQMFGYANRRQRSRAQRDLARATRRFERGIGNGIDFKAVSDERAQEGVNRWGDAFGSDGRRLQMSQYAGSPQFQERFGKAGSKMPVGKKEASSDPGMQMILADKSVKDIAKAIQEIVYK